MVIEHNDCGITDIGTLIHDYAEDTVIRYWVFRKPDLWTPMEQERKYLDETLYVNDEASYGKIEKAAELPDGDVLLGIRYLYEDWMYEVGDVLVRTDHIDFHKLSELSISVYDNDSDLPIVSSDDVRKAQEEHFHVEL